MMGKLHHVSLTCDSIEPCISFYQRFGFVEEKRYEDQEIIIVLLNNSQSARVELFEFKDSREQSSERQFLELRKKGISHLAIEVVSIEECHSSLSRLQECSSIQQARLGGFRYFFTTDPSGNNVEVLSPTVQEQNQS
ncbi:VOC family protein [Vibrio marisflavi]|uniref:VOC domain-containing protein n=1 Tax=Vibrio marisflavi CECT 7928 TaxID=634439 RepID=A0ABM9A946_9VIBR|nr:VOC family protein [Vibrio marisflavi]CAH0542751.1 hypothetical protein VMF7928_04188 [Vibrio marisflavi CECT 7928]